MPILATKAERQRVEYKSLTQHYRRIGPAAVLAALLCTPRRTQIAPMRNPQLAKSTS